MNGLRAVSAWVGMSPPQPPLPPRPLICEQRGQPLLRLPPLRLAVVEPPAQVGDVLLQQRDFVITEGDLTLQTGRWVDLAGCRLVVVNRCYCLVYPEQLGRLDSPLARLVLSRGNRAFADRLDHRLLRQPDLLSRLPRR